MIKIMLITFLKNDYPWWFFLVIIGVMGMPLSIIRAYQELCKKDKKKE